MQHEEFDMSYQHRSALLDEKSLVLTASKGDLDAFNQLVLLHQNMVFNHAYSLMNNPAAAEDVAQDSFLKAFQALNSFRGGSFRSWLLRIVTNSAYDILRRSGRHPAQPLYPEDENGEEIESAPWLVDPAASVEMSVEQNELSEEIIKIMNQLPEAYRNVLILVDIQQFDYMEVAETLRIPIGTVKSRLARARLQMKNLLQTNSNYAMVTTMPNTLSATCA
jgi:RNA polymerase sigma-70 factor (ECF subfamily)